MRLSLKKNMNVRKTRPGALFVTGAEVLVLSVFTLFTPHIIYELAWEVGRDLIIVAVYIIIYYYLIKSICVYKNEKRKYISATSDIKEIIKTEPKRKNR